MNIEKKAIVSFDFSSDHYFLVHSKDERFGDNGGYPVMGYSLNPRIDRSYKGKDDDMAIPTIYLSEEEGEQCKKAGFEVVNDSWDDSYNIKEKEEALARAIEEVSKDVKPYFIDSKGAIQKSINLDSKKHQQRMKWGNAFKSRENAVEYKIKLMNVLSTKNAVNAS